MSFSKCFLSVRTHTHTLISSAPPLHLPFRKEVIFPTGIYSVSWIAIIYSVTQTREPSLFLLISYPSSPDFQKVTSSIPRISPGLNQSYLSYYRTSLIFSPLPFKAILHCVSKLTFPSSLPLSSFSALRKIKSKCLDKTHNVLAWPQLSASSSSPRTLCSCNTLSLMHSTQTRLSSYLDF